MTLGVNTIKKKYKKNQAKQLGTYGWVGLGWVGFIFQLPQMLHVKRALSCMCIGPQPMRHNKLF